MAGGAARSYSEVEKILGKPLLATLSLRDRAVESGTMNPLPDFLKALKAIMNQGESGRQPGRKDLSPPGKSFS